MPKKKKPAPPKKDQTQRLQRLLASAGYGSRRQCEELIEAGRVEVDGDIITKLGTNADPTVNKIRVDGVLLKKQKLVYYAVNKPVGVVTTNSDPQGRPRVVDLVPKSERVFAVGRLDRSSEGLILLTNDGDLAQRLTHPKFGVRKIYRVTVAGRVDRETMKQMRQGIYIAEGRVAVEGAKIFKSRSKATEMEIVLREGKNREIRRILARLGHKVLQLRRIAVGPLRLGDMPPGSYRVVSREEIKKLQLASDPDQAEAPKRRTKKGARKGSSPTSAKPQSGGKAKGKKPGSRSKSRFDASSSDAGFAATPRSGAVIGAVIGGDAPEPSEESRPRRATKKRSVKRGATGGKKRATKKSSRNPSASKSRGKASKKSSTGRSGGRSGSTRAAGKPTKRTTKKRGAKKRSTKKRNR